MHELTQTRRKSDNRKTYTCTVCKQEWTCIPKNAYCPGVPVVPWGSEHGHLRTRTMAKKERIIIPEDAKPVAALRGEKEYFWLYDIRECERNPLTEGQKRSIEKREATIREKYGCPMCETRYLAREHEWFVDGVCQDCRDKVRKWNNLIEKVRVLVKQDIPILMLKTKEQRLMRWEYSQKYQITGYQMFELSSGNLVAERELACHEDYATLYGLLDMTRQSRSDVPVLCFPTEIDLTTFWEKMVREFGQELRHSDIWGWERLTTYLPLHQHIPLFPHEAAKGWREFPDPMYAPQERYFADLCKALSLPVEMDEPVNAMLRKIVMDLASRATIAFPGDAG